MRLAVLGCAALILASLAGPLAAGEVPTPGCAGPEAPGAEASLDELLAIDPASENVVPMTGCVAFCMAARRDCTQFCFQFPFSGEAVFSCGPDGFGGCEASCYCCEYPNCNGP